MRCPLKKRRRLLKTQNNKCYYCNIPLSEKTATLDHIIPRSEFGNNSNTNLVVACRVCNSNRRSQNIDDWKKISKFAWYRHIVRQLNKRGLTAFKADGKVYMLSEPIPKKVKIYAQEK